MKKKIAIPIEGSVLCPHFGHCQAFAFAEVEDKKIINFIELKPPEHQPGLYPAWIAKFGVTDVIAGGMGQHAINLFKLQNINVYVGAPIKTPVELIKEFLDGQLDLQANYCDH